MGFTVAGPIYVLDREPFLPVKMSGRRFFDRKTRIVWKHPFLLYCNVSHLYLDLCAQVSCVCVGVVGLHVSVAICNYGTDHAVFTNHFVVILLRTLHTGMLPKNCWDKCLFTHASHWTATYYSYMSLLAVLRDSFIPRCLICQIFLRGDVCSSMQPSFLCKRSCVLQPTPRHEMTCWYKISAGKTLIIPKYFHIIGRRDGDRVWMTT